MATGSVLAFWGVALLLIVVPGADWAFTIGAALRDGLVAPAVAGLVVGYTAMTLVVAAGTGALVAATPAALTTLTVAGGAYLIWLGARTLARPAGPVPGVLGGPVPGGPGGPVSDGPGGPVSDGPGGPVSGGLGGPVSGGSAGGTGRGGWGTLLRGIGVSGLNPKALLLFVALLPQFTDPAADWPVPVQLALLGAVFTLSCAAFYAVIGRFARTVLHARPAAARLVSRLSGLGMAAIGAGLLMERLPH